MKILTALLLVAAPAAAQAMGMHGGMHGMHGGSCGSAVTHLAIGLYALLAALGYWVLQHSAKEAANHVKRTGQALGWALIVISLLGVLCGAAKHARKGMCNKSGPCAGAELTGSSKMCDMPMMHSDCPMQGELAKKAETAAKKK